MFIETIRIENGKIKNLILHNNRIIKTQSYFYKKFNPINLKEIIKIPKLLLNNILKCKITYDHKLINIEYSKYIIRKINSLAIINNNLVSYDYKFYNRNHLIKLIQKKHDNILIIKNSYVTDTSFSNIVFYDGKDYFTPTTYLLNGTQRQFLLQKKIIKEKIIKEKDIKNFKEAFLINAMLNWENKIKININNIEK